MSDPLSDIGIVEGDETPLREILAPEEGDDYITSYYGILRALEQRTVYMAETQSDLPDDGDGVDWSLVGIAETETDEFDGNSVHIYDGTEWVDTFLSVESFVEKVKSDLDDRIDEEVEDLDDRIDEEVEDLDDRIDEEVEDLDDRIDEEVEDLDDRIDEEVEDLDDRIDDEVDNIDGVKIISPPDDVSDVSFDGGSGTSSDPYIINTAHQLQAVKDDLSAHYELGSDINLSGTRFWNNGRGFDPLGDWSGSQYLHRSFQGSFDGQGHTIHDLYINRDIESVGLFSAVYQGEIKNVTLKSPDVTGGDDTGSLVGHFFEGEIENVIIKSPAVSGSVNVGGLVGQASLEDWDNTCDITKVGIESPDITGDQDVGGIVGDSQAYIGESYVKRGEINCTWNHLGGIAGRQYDTIRNCYVTYTDLECGNRVGGITGFKSWDIDKTYYYGIAIRHDFSGPTTSIEYHNNEGAGIAPFGRNSGNITSSYYNNENSGGIGGTDLRDGNMTGSRAEDNMTGLNFSSTWETGSGFIDTPKLQWE